MPSLRFEIKLNSDTTASQVGFIKSFEVYELIRLVISGVSL